LAYLKEAELPQATRSYKEKKEDKQQKKQKKNPAYLKEAEETVLQRKKRKGTVNNVLER
jgi:hypothetical protein